MFHCFSLWENEEICIFYKLFELWNEYDDGEITTSRFKIQAASKITGLCPSVTSNNE